MTGDKGLYQVLASIAANHLKDLLFGEKFGALDIMNDEFGMRLLSECARLISAASDSLKTEQEIRQRMTSELITFRDRKKRDDSDLERFIEKVKERRICQDCSNDFGCIVTWH
jgi:hypothetical protein